MKVKITLTVLLTGLLSLSGLSQPSKHSFCINSDINFTYNITSGSTLSSYQGDARFSSFTISPYGGFFISDRILVGAGFELSLSKTEETQRSFLQGAGISYYDVKIQNRSFFPGVYAKYFWPLTEKLYLAGKLGFSYGVFGNHLVNLGGTEDSMSFWESFSGATKAEISFSPEIMFFVSEKVGLLASYDCLSFESTREGTNSNTRTSNKFNFDLNPSNIFFGVVVML